MPFIIVDANGNGQSVDIDEIVTSLKSLIQQFDADPQNEIGLIDACPEELLAQLLGAGYGPALTIPLAEATTEVLTQYPPLPATALSQLDHWMGKLAVRRNSESVETQAKSIVAAALAGDNHTLQTVRDNILGDPIEASAVMESVFLMCLTLIAVAKGALDSNVTLN